MVVVSDTGPLNYLVQIGEIDLLPRLYRRVIVPSVVWQELCHRGAPAAVQRWTQAPPPWLEIVPIEIDHSWVLDPGEGAALAIALRYHPPALLIIDDRRGRRFADAAGVENIGTLGVLRDASIAGWVNLPDAIERLRRTNFRISVEALQQLGLP